MYPAPMGPFCLQYRKADEITDDHCREWQEEG